MPVLLRSVFFVCALWALVFPQSARCCTEKKPLQIHFLGVGEGLAVLIEVPGEAPLLVDSGNPAAIGVLRGELRKRDIAALGDLVLTHPHLDHIGGFFTLRSEIPIGTLWDNGQSVQAESAANDMYRWYDAERRAHPNYKHAVRGTFIRSGSVRIEALSPPPVVLDGDWNKNSLVLLVTFGEFRALLMGDALTSTEKMLLPEAKIGPVSVLQVGHHGSKHASSESFLSRVSPELSVISVDAGNVRGYPASETIQRLGRFGPVLLTSRHGTVSIQALRDGTFRWSATHAD